MRVISGKYRGKKIFSVDSNLLKPTSDFLKETLFNIIFHHYRDYLIDKNFLDIFAGSGNIALEALSRGAKTITLVENNKLHKKVICKNLLNLPFEIICKDFIKTNKELFNKRFSVIYLDPPYNLNLLPKALEHLIKLNITDSDCIIITESKKNTFDYKNLLENKELNINSKLTLELNKIIGIKELHFFRLASVS